MIDYTQEDFTKDGQNVRRHLRRSRQALVQAVQRLTKGGGIYLATDGLQNLILAFWTWRVEDKKVVVQLPPRDSKKDVIFLKELIEAGRYRAVIDRRYPLQDVVEATRYVETEQKTGNVVVTVSGHRRDLSRP